MPLEAPGGSETAGDALVERDKPGAPWRLRADHANAQREFWEAAYERAVSAERKAVWRIEKVAWSSLLTVVEGWCPVADRTNVDAWIERDVRDFVRAVDGLDSKQPWKGWSPDGWLKWHNLECPGRPRQRREDAPKRARDPAPPEPALAPEESAQQAARALALVTGIGRGGLAVVKR